MKVAITGISSRLADGIVPLFEADPEITEILGIDIKEPEQSYSKVKFVKRDVRDETLEEDLKGYDVIIHLAFIVEPPLPKDYFSINVDGSKNVFNSAIKAGVKKIIHASSIAAYGTFKDNPLPIFEDHPLKLMKPKFYYNETKYLVEEILDQIEKDNPDVIITRFRPCVILFGTYGLITESKVISVAPKSPSQYIWVDDLAQAFYLATKNDAPGAFNMAGDNPLDDYKIAERLDKKLVKVNWHVAKFFVGLTYKLHIQRKLSSGWLRAARYPCVVDCSKAKKELGWNPKLDTLEAIVKNLEMQKTLNK